MKKIWVFIILTSFVVCTLFITVLFWTIHSGAPKLKIEFNPAPPWLLRPSQSLELNITIKNEGEAPAKNVNINFTAPTGFTIYQNGTNQHIVTFEELKEKEIKNQTLTITISAVIIPGNYSLNLIFYAENAPKKSYNYQIIVELPT